MRLFLLAAAALLAGAMIEYLESRIAPAAVLNLIDIDGDKITVTSSKGTKADLTAACTIGGVGLDVDLVSTADLAEHFAGTNLTISVHKAGAGNGSVDVSRIHAGGDLDKINLGKVSIAGNLGTITVGTNDPLVPAIKRLKVESLTGNESTISGNAGQITVQHDLTGILNAFNISKLTIGGSLLGGGATSGTVNAMNIGIVAIGGDIHGGDTANSGLLQVLGTLGSATIKGSIIGGFGGLSGVLMASTLGKVVVRGDIQGGNGAQTTGLIVCDSFSSITLKGDLIGSNQGSGIIEATGFGLQNGSLTVGGDVIGGTGQFSGNIRLSSPGAKLSIAGKLDGNNQSADTHAGEVFCPGSTNISVGQMINRGSIYAGV